MIKRIKNNLLHLNNLRKFAGYEAFRSAIDSNFKQKIMDVPANSKVLVLAPHPDDEVIGCGGTIKLHTAKENKVKIVYLTNTPSRKQEAEESSELLGTDDLIFWKYTDNQIGVNKETLISLKRIIEEYKPNIIYAPSFLDPNPDHLETAHLLYEVLKKTEFSGEILSYEIWSPIYANRLVNIDNSMDYKKKALQKHSSQLKDRNYMDAMVGLAQYRAGMFNAGKYAEAFFSCNRELYIKLFELLP